VARVERVIYQLKELLVRQANSESSKLNQTQKASTHQHIQHETPTKPRERACSISNEKFLSADVDRKVRWPHLPFTSCTLLVDRYFSLKTR
jgi:hypothetical protein